MNEPNKPPTAAPLHGIVLPRVLCKLRGMLVIAEVSVRTDGQPGKCPECESTSFSDHAGWTECDCGFAYLSSDLERLQA